MSSDYRWFVEWQSAEHGMGIGGARRTQDILEAEVTVQNAMRKEFWETPEYLREQFFLMLVQTRGASESEWRKILDYWD